MFKQSAFIKGTHKFISRVMNVILQKTVLGEMYSWSSHIYQKTLQQMPLKERLIYIEHEYTV